MRVVITVDAREEAAEAAVWFRRQAPNTVGGFRRRFRELALLLGQHPLLGARIGDTSFRQVSLEPYPYRVLYAVEDETVVVAGVLHESQSIESWLKRAGQ